MLHKLAPSALTRLSGRVGKLSLKRRVAAFSTKSKDLVLTDINEDTGVATLTMNRPPVNSLSLEMFQALSKSIKEIEASSPKVQSLVLASSLPTIFSAGLDIQEMHNPDSVRLEAFWNSFQQLYLDLYGSRLACIAAMEGHSPAAGCILALACDYRIMAAPDEHTTPTIGLNETKLGIVAHGWLGQLMVDTVGQREAEKGLALGLLYTPVEALKVGLIDEMVTKDEVVNRARAEAVRWGTIPGQARFATKLVTRKKRLDHLVANRKHDTANFLSFAQSDSVQRQIGMYLESLQKKGAK